MLAHELAGSGIRANCVSPGMVRTEVVDGFAHQVSAEVVAADEARYPLGYGSPEDVANTVGFVKGKSAIQIHRQYLGRERNFTGFHFWARGYCVSTVGLDEQKIRAYIRDQEEEEKRQELLPFGGLQSPSRGKSGA